jgi:hypothetical protein
MTDAVGGQWAGSYECSVCNKKRLTAASFSRKQLDRLRQQVSIASNAANNSCCKHELFQPDLTQTNHVFKYCTLCQGEGKLKCKDCVDRAAEEERKASAAKAPVAAATAAGTAAQVPAA